MQFDRIRRRELITLLSGAAAWPLAVRAQQPTMPVIGMLRSSRAEGFAYMTEALRAGLSEIGYEVGRNVVIEFRWAEEQRDRLPALAAELIRKPVAMIVANSIAALAAKATTTTVPIVFVTGSDLIGDGLVTSFSRPGGNITGISFLSAGTSGKRLMQSLCTLRTHCRQWPRNTRYQADASLLGPDFHRQDRTTWESRWPLNTYRERDASKLSQAMLDRLAEAERMTLDEYRRDLAERDKVLACYAELKAECDGCISLSAPAAAPLGLDSTGDPNCTEHVQLPVKDD